MSLILMSPILTASITPTPTSTSILSASTTSTATPGSNSGVVSTNRTCAQLASISKNYTDASGTSFVLDCGHDLQASDFYATDSTSFQGCFALCDNTNCEAFTYAGETCYLYSLLDVSTQPLVSSSVDLAYVAKYYTALQASASASSSSVASSTSASVASSISTSATVTGSRQTSTVAPIHSPALDAGSSAGIGVGVAVGVLLILCGLGLFYLRRKRGSSKRLHEHVDTKDMPFMYGTSQSKGNIAVQELDNSNTRHEMYVEPSELDDPESRLKMAK